MSPPVDPRPALDATRLQGSALPPGLRLEVVERAASTNADLLARAAAGEPEGLVLLTEHQTAGRGRLDRVWTTPPRACLTFSVLLRPQVALPHWPWLPLLTGYAVWRGLRAHTTEVGLKWPNDVLLGDRKVAGILLERRESPAGDAAVIGIGINVSLSAEELPVPHATSLLLADGLAPDREDLLRDVLRALVEGYRAWGAEPGSEAQRAAYAAACTTLGRPVRVELPGVGPGHRRSHLQGTAVDIDAAGRLVVDDGHRRVALSAGDVVHVRARD